MIFSILTSWWFILNTILGIFFIEHALYKTRPVRQVDEARDSQFPAFRRHDTQYWRRPLLYLGAPFLFIRLAIAILQPCSFLVVFKLLLIGHKRGTKLPEWKDKFAKQLSKINSKITAMVGAGIVFYKYEKSKVDYSKYLGPDWKPQYEKMSTVISNHSCWIDVVLIILLKYPSFTPKSNIKNWPVVGTIAHLAFNSFFVNRAGTAEERKQLALSISGRQKEIENSVDLPPLVMYPEGCTTNNTQLIQFRRGPFMALTSIQPITFKYYSPFFSLAHDILDVFSHMILCLCQFYSTVEIKELPVFKPNEYFFKHHQQPGEEDWQCYMRVIRQIMGESLGFELTDAKLEDKFVYKDLLYPNKGSKNKAE